MKTKHTLLLAIALGAAAGVVACTLQPQPLPPEPGALPAKGTDDDDSEFGGGTTNSPPQAISDAGPPRDASPVEDADAGTDGGDADDGDAGDGG